ncbi:MAG: cytidylate kinase-like family protein, partial [Deferribacterota bacterium]|nr:cytidylate kinase-like family protein [Deferribacterota bacterium]
MAILTISREYGCPTEKLSLMLSERLNYRYLDKEIIKFAAYKENVSEERIRLFDEDEHTNYRARISKYVDFDVIRRMFSSDNREVKSEFDKIKKNNSVFEGATAYDRFFDSNTFQRIINNIVISEAKKDNVIILGRGACFLLKDFPNAVHIRLVAPIADRIKWLTSSENVEDDEARRKIIEMDKRRANFVKYYFNENIDNKYIYHLVINIK